LPWETANIKISGGAGVSVVRTSQVVFADKALIVTGDGDLYCLVDYLIKNNNYGETAKRSSSLAWE